MKAFIFAYDIEGKTYYGEGYNEEDVRKAIAKSLNLSSVPKGRRPDFNKELKRIWDKKDKKYFLTVQKENTISKEKQKEIHNIKILKEDKKFLSGVNDIIIAQENLEFHLYNNTGHIMCYGNPNGINNDDIYRFKKLSDAYWYVRNNLIKYNLHNKSYKKTELTNLEMCDSFIAGFGNPALPNSEINTFNKSFPLSLTYKTTK
jgi:hypothetical protein